MDSYPGEIIAFAVSVAIIFVVVPLIQHLRKGEKPYRMLDVPKISRPFRHKLASFIVPDIYRKAFDWDEKRPMLEYIQLLNKTELIGVEVGVAEGLNAERILMNLDLKRLYLVDSYLDGYREMKNKAFKRLEKFDAKIHFIIEDSMDATGKIKEPVDFVYIDGDHSYEGVTRDIYAYWPLVKPGGYIGGHDFYGSYMGVVKAVLEFVDLKELELSTSQFDWWVQKP